MCSETIAILFKRWFRVGTAMLAASQAMPWGERPRSPRTRPDTTERGGIDRQAMPYTLLGAIK